MTEEKILITGANGQIGSVLTQALIDRYGAEQVWATDIREPSSAQEAHFSLLDVLEKPALEELVNREKISQIYHLAAILSAKGEQQPLRTWDINMKGWFNVLEVGRESQVQRIFFPSSIAVFGSQTPPERTPQRTHLYPETVYGISKVAGEQWGLYYFQRYGLDIRSLRYPGIIGYQSLPGGGTTDYAVDIFHQALQQGRYECFLKEDTYLPMIYMEDAIRATLELMEAPAGKIGVRTSYNLAGMSFSPREIAQAIRQHLPDFAISYQPDFRQRIADSWPHSIDDSKAREDWGWQPEFTLPAMVADMLQHLPKTLNA